MNEKYFKTTGHGKIYEQDGIRKRATDAVWDIDYDGREMDVDISITQNGKKNHIHETITNDELENMLHKETSPVPLEDRLREDFLVDNRVYLSLIHI